MRIARSEGVLEADLTARARIREAAIACFVAEGFDASFRTIAHRAGVSAGLITHHFGSKEALRAECDAEVLRRYQAMGTSGLADLSGYLRSNLADPAAAAQLVGYLLRAIQTGGPSAQAFLEHLVDSARPMMAASVEQGVVRPSRDEEARLRYLTYQSVGALLVQFLTSGSPTPEAFVASALDRRNEQMLPTLELYTDGLLTSRQMLEDYLTLIGEEAPC